MINLEFLANLVLVIICFVMGPVFIVISKHQKEYLHTYRISLQVLAFAYLSLAVINIPLLFNASDASSFQCLGIINLLVCSLQSMLFTFTLVTLYNQKFVTKRVVFFNLLPIALFVILYVIFYFDSGDVDILNITQLKDNLSSPTVVIRLLFFLFCIGQLIYYSSIFFREERIYKKSLDNYFSDLSKVRLLWVRYAFFYALFIGVIALSFQLIYNKQSDLFLSVVLLVFYFVFAIKYINYDKIFILIEPAVKFIEAVQLPAEIISLVRNRSVWPRYKEQIIERKDYLKEGITLEEMAQCLKIGRTSLSNYINSEENMNYNCWINSLRIEEAKSLFLSNPEYSITEVANLTGYTEQSNFTRNFKMYAGITPRVWRKSIESKG